MRRSGGQTAIPLSEWSLSLVGAVSPEGISPKRTSRVDLRSPLGCIFGQELQYELRLSETFRKFRINRRRN